MILGYDHFAHAIDTGIWTAHRKGEPITSEDLKFGPNSVDVRLGDKFISLVGSSPYLVIDPNKPDTLSCFTGKEQKLLLRKGDFYLGYTYERFNCNAPLLIDGKWRYFKQDYDGRSTMGRLGILSHCTAGFGDYGFDGNFTLELANVGNSPVLLSEGMRIGQIYFTEIAFKSEPRMYGGAYNNQYDRPMPPVLGEGRF